MVNRLEVDRAVFYALLLRGWQLVAGAVSVVLISFYFSEDVQGYYYTFGSLMALQAFFDLGLRHVIVNVASHEWSDLRVGSDGRIEGSPEALSRLVHLGRLLFCWYGVASLLFSIAVGIGGAWFLSQQADTGVDWHQQWTVLVILSGLLLWTMPFVALLMGCGEINAVNRFYFVQAVVTNLAVWAALALDTALWVAVAATAFRLVTSLVFLGRRMSGFFHAFRDRPGADRIDWTTEVWPLQWRRALTSILSWAAFSFMTPIMFHYHSPAVAGQMGMTWTLLTVLQAGALAWVTARVPLFGQLIARGDSNELDRVFRRVTLISLGIVTLGGVGLITVIYGLNLFEFRLAGRLLGIGPTSLFVVGLVLWHVPACLTMYIHAHKTDPLVWIQAAGYLGIGASAWWLGRAYGPFGAAAGFAAVVAGLIAPAICITWIRFRASKVLPAVANAQGGT